MMCPLFSLSSTGIAATACTLTAIEPGVPVDQVGILEEDLIVALGDKQTACVNDLHKLRT
jgi:hypothetical protein